MTQQSLLVMHQLPLLRQMASIVAKAEIEANQPVARIALLMTPRRSLQVEMVAAKGNNSKGNLSVVSTSLEKKVKRT